MRLPRQCSQLGSRTGPEGRRSALTLSAPVVGWSFTERRQLRGAQAACCACLLPIGGNLVALGWVTLPGLWKERAPHRVWLKDNGLLCCYFLRVHEEDDFQLFLRRHCITSLCPVYLPAFFTYFRRPVLLGLMPESLPFPWRQPTAQT